MPAQFHILTFGCQMNKSDSERARGLLLSAGMTETEDWENADFILFNTCSVRQTAEDRVYGMMTGIRDLKIKNPKLITGLMGCMAGRDKDGAIKARLPWIDLFFPTQEMVHLPRWISEMNPLLVDTATGEEYNDYFAIQPRYTATFQAFVTIGTGCNKFCAYCVVPAARGLQKDRPAKDIIAEVRALAEKGCLEITLLGQTVNWYRPKDPETFSPANPLNTNRGNYFGALLWELNQIEGIERIHWTAPHPVHMTPEVITALSLPKQVNFLHLPVQAGNNEILKRMNRPYTSEFYIDLVHKIKAAKPDIALGTDIIVGFCGESDSAFEETLAMYRECQFDISYNAMYSPRSHTKAQETMKDDVSKIEKKQRWNILHELMKEIVLAKNQQYIDKTVSVLVDTFANGMCQGNSSEMKRIHFRGDEGMRGTIQSVRIDRVLEWTLYGSLT